MQTIDPAATALVLISSALVFIMTPGLAFFYGGLVRRKNVLSIMMQSFISMGIVTAIWVFGGFSLAFGKDLGGFFAFFREGCAAFGQFLEQLGFFALQLVHFFSGIGDGFEIGAGFGAKGQHGFDRPAVFAHQAVHQVEAFLGFVEALGVVFDGFKIIAQVAGDI